MEIEFVSNLVKNGKIFSVEFIKRTDGRIRHMVARTGVRSHGSGEAPYDAHYHNLITVYDMAKRGFRNIPVDNILTLKAGGKTYQSFEAL